VKETLLKVADLCLGFGEVVHLRPANFVVFSGETIVLFGLQDSGRPALFRYLCGGKDALSGSVEMPGIPEGHWREHVYVSRIPPASLDFLTITEYLFLVKKEKKPALLWNKTRREYQSEILLSRMGLEIKPSMRLGRLSRLEKRLVEFAKALDTGAQIILMEEDFEGYTPDDMDTLSLVMRQLKKSGISFLINTNALRDPDLLADRIFLFRNAGLVKKIWHKDSPDSEISAYLYETPLDFPVQSRKNTEAAVPVIRYDLMGLFSGKEKALFLSVYAGEAVHVLVYDITHKNRLFNVISGMDQKNSPPVWLDGRLLLPREKRRFAWRRIVSVHNMGSPDELFQNLSPAENLLLPSIKKICRFGVFVPASAKKALERFCVRNIAPEHQKTESLDENRITALTLERWRIFGCKVLILLEPFLHLDQKTRELAARYLLGMKEEGAAIIIISSSVNAYRTIYDRMIRIEDEK
jgi:ABC-type sugar transport system ATPase subunit